MKCGRHLPFKSFSYGRDTEKCIQDINLLTKYIVQHYYLLCRANVRPKHIQFIHELTISI